MLNKIISRYLLFGVLYYAATFLYFQQKLNYAFILEGVADKYFCFQFAIYYLVGCSLIDKMFSHMMSSRINNKQRVLLKQGIGYLGMAFFQVSIVYVVGIAHFVLIEAEQTSFELSMVVINYFLFLLAAILLATISLLFRYSGLKVIKEYPQVIAYVLLITEVILVMPILGRSIPSVAPILFTWMFYNKSVVNIMVLCIYILICVLLLTVRAKRVDWE